MPETLPSTALATRPAGDPLALLQLAIERGVDPDNLEKLVSLQERYEANQAAAEFGRALAAFQAEMPPVVKHRANQAKKYAAYEDIMLVAQPILTRHNVSLSFSEDVAEDVKPGGEVVTKLVMTMRVRVGRHFEDKTVAFPVPNIAGEAQRLKMSEPQVCGSILTYFQRYVFCKGLNIIVIGEDTDAKIQGEAIGAEAVNEVLHLIADCERAGKPVNLPAFLDWIGAKSVQEIKRADFEKAVRKLREKLNGNGGAK